MDSSLVSSLLTAAMGATVVVAGVVAGWSALQHSRGRRPGINVKVPRDLASLPTRDEPVPLKSLTELLASLTQRRSIDGAYEVVAERTREAVGALVSAVFTRQGEEYEIQAISGLPEEARSFKVARDNPFIRYIEAGDKPGAHLIQGHPQLASFRKLVPNLREAIRVPLVASRGVYGFIMAANKRDGAAFQPSDVEVLCYLAVPIALHLHNSMLNQELEQTYTNTIIAMAKALEARDQFSRGHSEKVARCAVDFAQWLNLDSESIQVIREGALLHDLGKIGIPDVVLNKPDKLDWQEYETMRKHPDIGYSILKDLRFLERQAFLVRHHHERYDGSGYPSGLSKDQIPEAVVIVALADVYEALTSVRPYRPALSFEDTLAEMATMSGTHFDPRYFRKFVEFITSTHRQTTRVLPRVGATGKSA